MLHRIILGLLLAGWTLTAQAQQYPTKPIRVIVSIAAGSVTDVIMRAAGAELQTRLLVIENNGGTSGILAARQCARAPADGYTILRHLSFDHVLQPAVVREPAL